MVQELTKSPPRGAIKKFVKSFDSMIIIDLFTDPKEVFANEDCDSVEKVFRQTRKSPDDSQPMIGDMHSTTKQGNKEQGACKANPTYRKLAQTDNLLD